MPSFAELFAAADAQAARLPVVAAGGADGSVLAALAQAAERDWVTPVLAGDRSRIEQVASDQAIDLTTFRIVDESAQPAAAAVAEVRAGRASMLMKGQVSTPELMQSVLDRSTGLRTTRVIGQVVLMEVPRDNRRFLMSDTGVTIAPSLEQKEDLLGSVADIARGLGCPWPRIALLSATEKPTSSLPDTEEAAEMTRRGIAGRYGECIVEGPLSFDLAYSVEAAARKGIRGEVSGGADAMLFPNLLAANLTVKAMMYTADCRFGGVLCGAACPVVFMSRADDVATRLRSLAFALAR